MERDLLVALKSAKDAVEATEQQLKTLRETERQATQALVDYLDAKGASATGRYDGLGWAKVNAPRLFASFPKEQQEAVFAWLKAHGQDSAMKLTVHPSTFSQIVSECLRDNGELPPGTTYYLQPQVRLYGGLPNE